MRNILGLPQEVKDLNRKDFIKNLIEDNSHAVVLGNSGKTIFIENVFREFTDQKTIVIDRDVERLKNHFNYQTDFYLTPTILEDFDFEDWISKPGKSTIFFGMHYSEEGVKKQLKFIENAIDFQIKNNNNKLIVVIGEMRATDIINYSKGINSKSQSIQVFLLLKNIQNLNENFDPILPNVKTIVYFNEEPFAQSNIENISGLIGLKGIQKEIKNLQSLESLVIQDNKILGKCQISMQKATFLSKILA